MDNILTGDKDKPKEDGHKITAWVLEKVGQWRDHRVSNYDSKWETYERIWRGRTQKQGPLSETFVSPATQQAVESSVAEIEETVFGRGAPFDIRDDVADAEPQDIQQTKAQLWDDLQKTKNGVRKAVSESLINAAVYGTGITELQVETADRKVPIQVPTAGGVFTSANTSEEVSVKWRSIVPNNFVIDPNATCIDDAMGCAIEEFIGKHTLYKAQERGWYKKVDVPATSVSDHTLEKDKSLTNTDTSNSRVKIVKYYGLAPRSYIEAYKNAYEEEPEYEELTTNNRKERLTQEEAEAALAELEIKTVEEVDPESDLVEAIVVIANDGTCLKAEESPYIMEDRPIVAFAWDYVPGRFWGRGLCEKGLNAQMVLDEEIRNRLALLDYSARPMVGLDATRLPRGFKFEVKRGKSLLFNGKPSEIMEKFTLAELDPNTWQNAEVMERMVFQATGAADLSGIPGDINGEATAAGMSMAMSGVIKRTKRVILNFYDQYFMPAVQKTAWRYMQFDPNRYIAQDYEFLPASTMGIMAREYEQTQLVGLLNNMQPGTPQHNAVLMGVIENSSLHGRENILTIIEQANQPDPKAQALQEKEEKIKEMAAALELKNKAAEASEREARAKKISTETALLPAELKVKYIASLSKNAETESEFANRVRVAELALKEKDIESNERIAAMQVMGAQQTKKLDTILKMYELSQQDREQEFIYDDQGNIKGTKTKAATK